MTPDPATFRDLVRAMRSEQVAYEKARTRKIESRKRELERRVDAWLVKDAERAGVQLDLDEGEEDDATDEP